MTSDKIQSFKGEPEEDVGSWLKKMEIRLKRMEGMEDGRNKIDELFLHLEGAALKWFTEREELGSLPGDFAGICEAMKEKFGQQSKCICRMTPGLLPEYIKEFERISQCFTPDEALKVKLFRNGLDARFMGYAASCSEEGFAALKRHLLDLFERIQEEAPAPLSVFRVQSYDQREARYGQGPWRSREERFAQHECYNCGEIGHISPFCPHPRRGGQRFEQRWQQQGQQQPPEQPRVPSREPGGLIPNKGGLAYTGPEAISILRQLAVLMAKRARETLPDETQLRLKLRKVLQEGQGGVDRWEVVQPHIPSLGKMEEEKLQRCYEQAAEEKSFIEDGEFGAEEIALARSNPMTAEEKAEWEALERRPLAQELVPQASRVEEEPARMQKTEEGAPEMPKAEPAASEVPMQVEVNSPAPGQTVERLQEVATMENRRPKDGEDRRSERELTAGAIQRQLDALQRQIQGLQMLDMQPAVRPKGEVPLGGGPYSVVKDLYDLKADISLGQLLDVAPMLRTQLKQGISREGRSLRVLLASTPSRGLTQGMDHTLAVEVEGKPAKAIVDSGANCNVVNLALLTPGRQTQITRTNFVIQTAGVTPLLPLGVIQDLPISVFGAIIRIDALVVDGVEYQCILGKPFLQETNAVASWEAQEYRFQFGSEKITVDFPRERGIRVAAVRASEGEDEVVEVIEEFQDLFIDALDETGVTHVAVHEIDTGDAPPVRAKPRRFSPMENAEIDRQVELLLDAGKIQPSSSPWRSNLLFVPKPDGSLRMCIDFRPLNRVTKKDAQSLPSIPELLDEFGGHSVFSCVDLFSGYFQVPLAEAAMEKTAFWCRNGLYEFRVLPFGLCNAPATFQRAMEGVLSPLLHRNAAVYIDDVIFYSKDRVQHANVMRQVFGMLRKAGLKINRKKSQLAKDEIKVLGFKVNKEGIFIDEDRVKAIQELPVPTDVGSLQSVLGSFGFCRRFIPNFAELSVPLTKLLRKDQIWTWKEEEQRSFRMLKEAFLEHGVLRYPDFAQEFEVHTDASNVAIGAEIRQHGKLVSTASRKLTGPETRYSVTEREALAIVWALKTFRHYLLGSRFVLRTDHQCLTSLASMKDPTGRVARWLVVLGEYDMRIEYVRGQDNSLADYLSRQGSETGGEGPHVLSVALTTVDPLKILEGVLKGEVNVAELSARQRKSVARKASKYYLENGILFKRSLFSRDLAVVFEEAARNGIVQRAHGTGHPTARRMFDEITENFYWTGLYKDCERVAEGCMACAMSGRPKVCPVVRPLEAHGMFEAFHLDFVGPLSDTANGNRYILVAVCRCSKWLIACPTKVATCATVCNFIMKEIVERFGRPAQIVTDRGSPFVGKGTDQLLQSLEIEHVRTTAYHPQANGQVERYNGTLKAMLGKLCRARQQEWDTQVAAAVFVINARKNVVLGISPFEFVYGVPARRLGDATWKLTIDKQDAVMSRLQELKELEKMRAFILDWRAPEAWKFDQKVDFKISEGDVVLLWDHTTQLHTFGQTKWKGPYQVESIDDYGNYYLKDGKGVSQGKPINGQRLRRIPGSSGNFRNGGGVVNAHTEYGGLPGIYATASKPTVEKNPGLVVAETSEETAATRDSAIPVFKAPE